MSIGDAEIKTQERVIRFFKDPEILGYQYIGNLSDNQNKNIKEDRLRQYLRLKGYADKLIDAAVMQLQQEAGNLSRGVYDANKTVYSRLKYGIPVSESPEKLPVTVELIDEANPLNNDFAIAEEVTVVEQQEKRPDLVIYLNGIAVAVIELKRSSISVSEGIRQNLHVIHDEASDGVYFHPSRTLPLGVVHYTLVEFHKCVISDCHHPPGIDSVEFAYPLHFLFIYPVRGGKNGGLLKIDVAQSRAFFQHAFCCFRQGLVFENHGPWQLQVIGRKVVDWISSLDEQDLQAFAVESENCAVY